MAATSRVTELLWGARVTGGLGNLFVFFFFFYFFFFFFFFFVVEASE